MFRSFFVALSKIRWAQRIIIRWKFAWRLASRFVAGVTLAEAMQVVNVLNTKGILVTVDHLGENTTTPQEADQACSDVILALDAINKGGARANVSVKLTQIGLGLDDALCQKNLVQIVDRARETQNFIRIDMEDSARTEATISMYYRMRQMGFENLGIVIQAYLFRSEADINNLMDQAGRVRLCKGAYKEPRHVAFPKKRDFDRNYDRLADRLILGSVSHGSPAISPDGRVPPIPAFATHDPERIAHVMASIDEMELPQNAIEFQMLYGIRRDLQEKLAAQGYPVRVYVPYGTRWYPYFMRRLAERPANLWFFISNFFHG
jgi:proline dehydrogenase